MNNESGQKDSSGVATSDGLTGYVSEFIASTEFEKIPVEVCELAKKSILDGLGVALSGAHSAPVDILIQYFGNVGAGSCTVIGSRSRFVARTAALVNGTAMHADDYDDTLQADVGRFQGIHVTAPVLSASFAVAESRQLSGRDLLTAYVTGVEVAGRIFDSTNVNHSLSGFHATATCGMLGASAAVSRLLGFDSDLAAMALGLAATQAGGLLENIGTMTKPYHAGRSAEGAIVANELVERGFTASNRILESAKGFYAAQGGSPEEARIRGRLGNPWTFSDRGIALKPFPNCALTHPALTWLRKMIMEHDLNLSGVAGIRVRTSQNVADTLRNHLPDTPLEAKFSMEFGMAALLVERRCGLSEFNEQLVHRPEIRGAMGCVTYDVFSEDEARRNGYPVNTTFITLEFSDGRTLTERVDWGKGSKVDPMTMEEVAEKFLDCANYARWSQEKSLRAITLVRDIEHVSNVSELAACFAN